MAQKVRLKVELQITDEDIDNNGTGTIAERLVIDDTWADGTNDDGQADLNYVAKAQTASSTPTDIDLAGSLTRRLHTGTLTLVDLAGVVLRNKSSTTALRIGGDTNSVPIFGAAADFIVVPPGGTFVWTSKKSSRTVTAGTGDIIQIDTASGTAEYDIYLWGRSA